MPRRTYNTFFKGIQQDDFLTGGANIIEAKNMDGVRDGYFATLGPKSQKLLTTLAGPSSIYFKENITLELNEFFIGDLSGNIYRGDSLDNTPSYSLVSYSGNKIHQIINFNGYYYFFHNNDTSSTCRIARIAEFDIEQPVPDWTAIDESWETVSALDNIPVIVYGDYMYIGKSGGVTRIDNLETRDDFNFADDLIVGITVQGTTFKVYSRNGQVYFWDGTSASYSSSQDYSFRIRSVAQFGGIDYVISEDGDHYISSGYQVQRVTKSQESLRLDDNSNYGDKLNFTKTTFNGNILEFARSDLYMVSSNDTVPGIYKYGRLIPGLPQGYHKLVTTDNTNTNIDELFDIKYYERTISRMYFGYKQGITYGVDFFDIKDTSTVQDGYVITDVFTGGTMFNKKIDRVRITTSYTSGDNYIKLYGRKNNGAWELVETINEVNDTIKKKNISQFKGDFVDIQWKVEIHNDLQTDTPPLLHELSFDYTIIQQ